jgi:hypothetical protein
MAARNAPSTTIVTSVATSQARIHSRMEGCYRDRAPASGSAAVGEELSDVAVILEEVVELDDVVRRE